MEERTVRLQKEKRANLGCEECLKIELVQKEELEGAEDGVEDVNTLMSKESLENLKYLFSIEIFCFFI